MPRDLEGNFKPGDRIYMVSEDQENVLEINVVENRSDDNGFEYDLVIIRVAKGDYDFDVRMGDSFSFSGLYNRSSWRLTDRLQI